MAFFHRDTTLKFHISEEGIYFIHVVSWGYESLTISPGAAIEKINGGGRVVRSRAA